MASGTFLIIEGLNTVDGRIEVIYQSPGEGTKDKSMHVIYLKSSPNIRVVASSMDNAVTSD